TSAFGLVKSAVSNGMTAAVGAVTGFASKFLEAGKNIVTSIADGIKGAVGKVKDAIGSVTKKIRDFLPFSPAKDGALRDIMDIQLVESIAETIKKGEKTAVNAMSSVTDAIHGEMPIMDISEQINGIHRQSNKRMNYDLNNELEVSKQPIVIQTTVDLDGRIVAKAVNEVNAIDSQIRRF